MIAVQSLYISFECDIFHESSHKRTTHANEKHGDSDVLKYKIKRLFIYYICLKNNFLVSRMGPTLSTLYSRAMSKYYYTVVPILSLNSRNVLETTVRDASRKKISTCKLLLI